MGVPAPSAAILIATDDPARRADVAAALRAAGHHVEIAPDGMVAQAVLAQGDVGVVLADLQVVAADGLDKAADVPVIVVTPPASVGDAVRLGAADYVLDPVLPDDVLARVERALAQRRLAWEAALLRAVADPHDDVEPPRAASRAMADVWAQVRALAPSRAPVLILGERGTGKEVLARAVHRASPMASRLFIVVDCAALPEALLAHELFGRGTPDDGLLGRARGGSVFLDEIAALPRALQERVRDAIGETGATPGDVRVMMASQRDLHAMAAADAFDAALLRRLTPTALRLPPLRERREDIPALVDQLVWRYNRRMKCAYRGASDDALAALVAQPWPGNVRELGNAVEHAMIVGDGEWLRVDDLPSRLRPPDAAQPAAADDDLRTAVRSYERTHIEGVLRRLNGDKRTAAERLGVSLSSLYRKLDGLGIGLGVGLDAPRG